MFALALVCTRHFSLSLITEKPFDNSFIVGSVEAHKKEKLYVAFGRVEFHLSGGWLHHQEAWLHPWGQGDATIIGTLQPLADLWPTWKVTRKHLQIFQILIVLHSQDCPISKSPESMLAIY